MDTPRLCQILSTVSESDVHQSEGDCKRVQLKEKKRSFFEENRLDIDEMVGHKFCISFVDRII